MGRCGFGRPNDYSMKKLRSLIVAIIFSVLIFGSYAGRVSAQPGPFGDALRALDGNYKTLSTLKASVKMDQYSAQIDEHDVREGTIIYIPQKGRDAAFKIVWTRPVREELSVINKQYVIYRPNLNQAYIGSIESIKRPGVNGALSIVNMSKADLKTNFEIKYAGLETLASGRSAWHLVLFPYTASSFKSADVWIDDKTAMVLQVRQLQNNNDATTILLMAPDRNTKVNWKEVQINLPPGTNKIST